jgi:hypothetical protein
MAFTVRPVRPRVGFIVGVAGAGLVGADIGLWNLSLVVAGALFRCLGPRLNVVLDADGLLMRI